MDYCCVGRCGAILTVTQYGEYGELQDVQCECGYGMQCGSGEYPETLCQGCERGFVDVNYS